ncbi:putative B3 domain-containing protein REM15 isoform X4 [Capsicum annuum]|uniref:putative B3 domain-containing protein REM15 isoform X4 n=1 Tax=Capsicum annuum TaxID=4072 RepID=UPI001FB05CB0|nr:putative B3 domain-containing protein REM15 isoform X4 [Capsicum annuum]
MKVPPVKPHFFKPVLPGFKHGLKIPVGFLKHLEGPGEKERAAVLKRDGKKCLVKLNGQKLEEGWEQFAEEHDLQLGDLLVFRHDGNMEFDVSIFNLSHYDREYAEYLLEEEEGHTIEATSKIFESKEAATHNPIGRSQFICTIKQYSLRNGYLRIPNKFAKANGLINKDCGLIIRDERQRSWNLRIYTSCSQVYMGGRWGEFRAANDIKAGDQIMFEVVSNGEQPVWKFHEYFQQEEKEAHTFEETSQKFELKDITNPCSVEEISKNSEFKEAASHNPIGQSHFECTIKSYCISKGYLRLPRQFAVANGLINKKCDLIIRDERQRTWNLRLATHNTIVHILGGWKEFCIANGIKEGHYMMFEVVANGEKPVWKFHDKPNPSIESSRKAFPHVEEAAAHKPSGHSRFVCTIKPYCLTYGYLCLPKEIALRNGLISKKCDLIIRDECQRSWNLILRPFGTSVCIRGGWDEFRDAYCLKEGDHIMFEVVTDGETPIWKFHGKVSDEIVRSIIEE